MKKRSHNSVRRSRRHARRPGIEGLELRQMLFGGPGMVDIAGPLTKDDTVQLSVDRLIDERESALDPIDVRLLNDSFAQAEFIPLGFDDGEDDAIDIRGELIEPNTVATGLSNEVARANWVPIDDGSILTATVIPYSNGIPFEMSGAIGDSVDGFNANMGGSITDPTAALRGGDGDYYALEGVEVGQVITAHVRTRTDTGLLLYNRFGEIIEASDNTDGLAQIFTDDFISFRVQEPGDYYLAVVPASGAGFLPPKNPFDPSSVQGGPEGPYTLTAGVDATDIDYYEVDLQAGDIIGLNTIGAANLVSLYGADGQLRLRSGQDLASAVYPETSPLPYGGTASLGYVIDEAGTYYVEVTGYNWAGYRLQTRLFRSPAESEPAGTRQILFLDFNGAELNAEPFGGPVGLTELSPLRQFMSGWRLQDENALIDAIVNVVKENLIDDLKDVGKNPNFQLEIRNSKDHADPFGQPNVSRIIVGGSVGQLGINTIGIAQSVDVGNFNREETGIVLLDLLSGSQIDPNSLNQWPIAPGARKLDLVATGVGNIVAHEAGHFYGAWHTDQTNNVPNLMDQGGDLGNTVGIGEDSVWGTQDDVDVDFADDVFVVNERIIGRENTLQLLAFALTGGKGVVPGAIPPTRSTLAGAAFNDLNGNGTRDTNDVGVAGIRVYIDNDNNGQFGIGEPFTFTNAAGNFSFEGSVSNDAVLRVVAAPGQLLVAPLDGYAVEPGKTISGLNFATQMSSGTDAGIDRSDAPASYGQATHGIVRGLSLGSLIDGELSVLTDNQDTDDDGIILGALVAGKTATGSVTVATGGQSPAALQAWVDFNADGVFSASEQIIKDRLVLAGSSSFSFLVPANAHLGATYARFRYGYERGLGPIGASVAGEVEDYRVTISETGGGGPGVVDPDALNDTATVLQGSVANVINVLANDVAGSRGEISILSVGPASAGGIVDINGERLIYTPSDASFVGTESFTYTISDGVVSDTAVVTVIVQPVGDGGGDLVRFRLATVDDAGNPLTQVNVGDSFNLNVYTQDLRPDGFGVFAGYVDVRFDPALASLIGTSVTFGESYPAGRVFDISVPGVLDEVGAFAGVTNQLGPGELLLFSVPLQADGVGVLSLASDPADILPANEVLLGDIAEGIPSNRIDYTSTSLTILPPQAAQQRRLTNPVMATDVDNNGVTTPRDVLLLIREINEGGARRLAVNAAPVANSLYLDVDGNGSLTSRDVLMVIDAINRRVAEERNRVPVAAMAAAVDAAFDRTSGDDAEAEGENVLAATLDAILGNA